MRDGPASGWRQKGAGQVVNLSPRKTDSAQALRLLFGGFDYLGELDFPIDEAHGQGFVFRAWLEGVASENGK